MNRKEFIQQCGFACLGISLSSSLLESCMSANYFAKNQVANNMITLKKSEFFVTDKGKTSSRKYVLVKPDQLQFPICVFKLSEQEYSAVLMECSHRSCELHNQGDFLQCPCHGSEFSNKGIVQNPPAEQNLKTFSITTDHENIFIKL